MEPQKTTNTQRIMNIVGGMTIPDPKLYYQYSNKDSLALA